MNSGLQLSQYCPFERDKFKVMILNHIKHFHWEELCWIHKQVFQLSKENVHTLISHGIHPGTIIRSIRTNINCKVVPWRERHYYKAVQQENFEGFVGRKWILNPRIKKYSSTGLHIIGILKILVYTVNTNIWPVIFTENPMCLECYKAYNWMKWELLWYLLIIYEIPTPKNKCKLCSPTLSIWDGRQVKVILDLWHRCY